MSLHRNKNAHQKIGCRECIKKHAPLKKSKLIWYRSKVVPTSTEVSWTGIFVLSKYFGTMKNRNKPLEFSWIRAFRLTKRITHTPPYFQKQFSSKNFRGRFFFENKEPDTVSYHPVNFLRLSYLHEHSINLSGLCSSISVRTQDPHFLSCLAYLGWRVILRWVTRRFYARFDPTWSYGSKYNCFCP